MHLHFEKNSNTKCDCTILALSWMGKVRIALKNYIQPKQCSQICIDCKNLEKACCKIFRTLLKKLRTLN